VIPVPVHSPETGWALTLSGIVSTVIADGPPSSILAVASRSRMHQQSLTLDTALNIGSQWRANGRVAIEDWPTQYFGLGNDTSTDDEEFYDSRNNELRFDLQRELVPGVWVGPQILWRDYDIRDVVSDGLLDAQRPSGFDGGTVSGAGLVATYDTRDDLYTPRSGLYLSGGAVSHGSGLGSNFRFQRYTLDARQFLSVRTKWVLALHQYIESTSGNGPFQELPRLGEAAPPSRLRGYAAAAWLGIRAHTPSFTDADGREMPGSIAVLEQVELGGLEQWILIRGRDVRNPVLLWLHGGPGAAQMPLAHHLDARLEEHFVVVHWDQRGAGKSNHRGFDESTMQVERYLQDAVELIEYLRERLDTDRIVLLGHSWGTRLGIELIHAHPEYFSAFVSVAQAVNHERATRIAHEWLARTIDSQTAPADWQALSAIEVPARMHRDYRALIRLVEAYGGSFDFSVVQLARIALRAPEYDVMDYLRLLEGMNRGGGPMHEGGRMSNFDYIESIPAVEVPVYFFAGANDYNTPLALIREYYQVLNAPRKELVVFQTSAHLPFLAEHGKFVEEVIRVVR
jgi:pimeloyl-ACP methyl ester carboxylesterase